MLPIENVAVSGSQMTQSKPVGPELFKRERERERERERDRESEKEKLRDGEAQLGASTTKGAKEGRSRGCHGSPCRAAERPADGKRLRRSIETLLHYCTLPLYSYPRTPSYSYVTAIPTNARLSRTAAGGKGEAQDFRPVVSNASSPDSAPGVPGTVVSRINLG